MNRYLTREETKQIENIVRGTFDQIKDKEKFLRVPGLVRDIKICDNDEKAYIGNWTEPNIKKYYSFCNDSVQSGKFLYIVSTPLGYRLQTSEFYPDSYSLLDLKQEEIEFFDKLFGN